jgi:hypothetical protein
LNDDNEEDDDLDRDLGEAASREEDSVNKVSKASSSVKNKQKQLIERKIANKTKDVLEIESKIKRHRN